MADYPKHPSGRLLFPWEIPARPGGGVAPLAGEPGPNPVVNTPAWMREALALKGDEVPTNVWLPNIQPTLEVFQDGWGIATYGIGVDGSAVALTLTAAAITGTLLTADEGVHRRIIEIQVTHTAPGTIRLRLFKDAFGAGVAIASDVPVGAGVTLGTAQILNGHPLIVPPRFRLAATALGLAGAETMSLQFHTVTVGAGFHAPAY